MSERILFPSWRFHVLGDTQRFPDKKVLSQEEADALGPDWTNGDTEVFTDAAAVSSEPGQPPPAYVSQKYPGWREHPVTGVETLFETQAEYNAACPNATASAPAAVTTTSVPSTITMPGTPPMAFGNDVSHVDVDPPVPTGEATVADTDLAEFLAGNVADVLDRLKSAPESAKPVLLRLQDAERSGKNRKGVLNGIAAALGEANA